MPTATKIGEITVYDAIKDSSLSLWVSASAGSGKTKILIDRIILLLLNSARGILCLTFTNSAVAEIKARVNARLSSWQLASDHELSVILEGRLDRPVGVEDIELARSLFKCSRKILKVHTIHSFCAGLVLAEDVIDDREQELLLGYSIRRVLPNCGSVKPRWHTRLMLGVALELVRSYGKSLFALEPGAFAKLAEAGLEGEDCSDAQSRMDLIVEALASGSEAERKRAECLRSGDIEAYKRVFLCKDLACKKVASIASSKLLKLFPQLHRLIVSEQKRVAALIHNILWEELLTETNDWIEFVKKLIAEYENAKCGRLSYDDLIVEVLSALESDLGLLYRVDSGLEHLLVDEAQDNSELHWRVISSICSEFFAGQGSSSATRTIMVVGDVKQSVYSFMGAKASLFLEMRNYFKRMVIAGGYRWRDFRLDRSFRSGSGLLGFIDGFFNFTGNARFLDPSLQKLEHSSGEDFGKVVLWVDKGVPIVEPDITDYLTILPIEGMDDPDALIMATIDHIHAMLKSKRVLKCTGRAVEAGDFMILYQRWGGLVEKTSKALEQREIAFCRSRVVLQDQPLVRFLLDLGEFIVDPANDLVLYRILSSSVVGYSHQELFQLSYFRTQATLFAELNQKGEDRWCQRLRGFLDLKGNALEVYQVVIAEVMEALSLSYGQSSLPLIEIFIDCASHYKFDLRNFVKWFKQTKIEHRNPLDTKGVRLTTVHSAKGMESPIVFMIDCDVVPDDRQVVLYDGSGLPLVTNANTIHHPYCKGLKKSRQIDQQGEYWRLFYVGLTRAKEEVHLLSSKTRRKDSWYKMVKQFAGLA